MFPECNIDLKNAMKKLAFTNNRHDHIASEFRTGKFSVLIFRSFWAQGIYKICIDRSIQKKSIFAYLIKAQIRNES